MSAAVGPEAIALRSAAVQLYAQLPAPSHLPKAIRWLDDAVRTARTVCTLAHVNDTSQLRP